MSAISNIDDQAFNPIQGHSDIGNRIIQSDIRLHGTGLVRYKDIATFLSHVLSYIVRSFGSGNK